MIDVPPHVQRHIQEYMAAGHDEPILVDGLDRSLRDRRPYNLLYPVSDDVYIHIEEGSGMPRYHALEPEITGAALAEMKRVRDITFEEVIKSEAPQEEDERRNRLAELVDRELKKSKLDRHERAGIMYRVLRDVVGTRQLDPLLNDPWIEDIHGIGIHSLWVVHKIFGACQSNIRLGTHQALDGLLLVLSEAMGRPVSTARPIVDGALPDGSRINIVFGEEVSRGGSSFTIRKFSDVPLPLTQLIAWGTMDPNIGAYLWLCMEHGMSVFVSGETASGKTTTLNALLPLVPPDAKILTAEDTPEVRPPHLNWQQLVTRDAADAGARVDMGDLLKVGLRSRPDRIVVGEIRGAEGAVAFQAMQTGYATYATFHASSVAKLVQRFTSAPINVPGPFLPNLHVVLVQLAVHVGGKRLRRVIEVEEIEGYSRRLKVPITRQVFRWDPVHDRHEFGGRNNSYVLETLVAPRLGLADPRDVYLEMDRRAKILQRMVKAAMFDPNDVQREYQETRAAVLGGPTEGG
jgi:archaeal flagellar protein FlaI